MTRIALVLANHPVDGDHLYVNSDGGDSTVYLETNKLHPGAKDIQLEADEARDLANLLIRAATAIEGG